MYATDENFDDQVGHTNKVPTNMEVVQTPQTPILRQLLPAREPANSCNNDVKAHFFLFEVSGLFLV
ncbi:hypothetical protein TCAL_17198 [Tigriopus californicus]|uniref:Uncharacterized protein n=1 Tax=Tigriopus californicus TaxID=6832 RepID=A0A553N6I2_TIGCA|nr:hypothetical protein TCAL_17198 [Tigriopus californicus]